MDRQQAKFLNQKSLEDLFYSEMLATSETLIRKNYQSEELN